MIIVAENPALVGAETTVPFATFSAATDLADQDEGGLVPVEDLMDKQVETDL